MSRELDTQTLDAMAKHLAREFLGNNVRSKTVEGLYVQGPNYVMHQLYNMDFKDEHEYLVAKVRDNLGKAPLKDFEDACEQKLKPRDDKVLATLLADKLAIDPSGKHISGKVGSVQVGGRPVGMHTVEVESRESRMRRRVLGLGKEYRETTLRRVPLIWPVYAGEDEERLAGSDAVDELPLGAMSPSIGASITRISNELAIAALDAGLDRLDEGSAAAVIQGRTGTQPADPDTAVAGTLLFTCLMTDPAFAGATDDTPGAIAAASTITDDSSADATGTVTYCRVSATNDNATPLDDHIDVNAGVSDEAVIFNTAAIVSGGVVSITSFTMFLPESA